MNLHPGKLFPEVENLELLNHQPVRKRPPELQSAYLLLQNPRNNR